MSNVNGVGQDESEKEDWITLSEKTTFVLAPEQWDEFVKLLDNPPIENPGPDRVMEMVPPWELLGKKHPQKHYQ